MPEKKPKKVSFTEQDAATLTQRYDATTVLTLLQEVAQYPYAKIDWNELVKNTSTGISNAREYQMLWRHLAYHDSLIENLEDGAEPLDDDSDLECELETLPPICGESASEAVACVKVMIASRSLSESTPSSSTIEAPLTINVPVCQSSRTPNESSESSNLMQGTNIIFPVTVQRQTLPTVPSTDSIETKGLGGGNMASKRKRIAWSEEEDKQLRDAVQRFGEGNWATMAKGDNFPIKRTATQLAQRWSFLRKKDGSTDSGSILTSKTYTTAEQLATRHSLSLALDMPFKKLTAPGMTNHARTSLNTSSKSLVQHVTTEASTVNSNFVPPQHPSQRSLMGSCGSSAKSTSVPEKPVSKVNPTLNPVVKATTVAAGAQRVSPSDSVLQLEVAQARNEVPTTSSSLTKPSTPAGFPSELKVQFCTVSSAASVHSQSVVAITSPASCTSLAKAASSAVDYYSLTALSTLPEQDKHDTSMVNEVPMKQEVKTKEEFRVSNPGPAPNEVVQIDEKLDQDKSMHIPLEEGKTLVMESTRSKQVSEDKAVSKNQVECENQGIIKNTNS